MDKKQENEVRLMIYTELKDLFAQVYNDVNADVDAHDLIDKLYRATQDRKGSAEADVNTYTGAGE